MKKKVNWIENWDENWCKMEKIDAKSLKAVHPLDVAWVKNQKLCLYHKYRKCFHFHHTDHALIITPAHDKRVSPVGPSYSCPWYNGFTCRSQLLTTFQKNMDILNKIKHFLPFNAMVLIYNSTILSYPKELGILNRLSWFLPIQTKVLIYDSLVFSHLNVGICPLGF